MFGDKNLIPVFLREHGAGVKTHAQGSDVRTQFGGGLREFSAIMFASVLRIRNRFSMTIGIAEVQPGLRRMVEFVGRLIVTEMIPTIVGEP